MSSPYHDHRIEFFRSYFDRGLPVAQYLETGKAHEIENWERYAKDIQLTAAQQHVVASFKRRMPVLVLSGIWCGDCQRQGPMLAAIERACPLIEMRYVESRPNPELQDELRINGAAKVPVVVAFSEDFYELSRFGDRHLSVYRHKAETELAAACDPGFGSPIAALAAELDEWVRHFERLQLILRLSPLLRKRHGD